MALEARFSTHGLGRRSFLSSSAVALSVAACCRDAPPFSFAPAGPDLLDRPIADAHAHVFNAQDLPLYQFVLQCYVERYAGVLSIIFEPILKQYADLIQGEAPNFDDEEAGLPKTVRASRLKRPRPAVELLTDAILAADADTTGIPSPEKRKGILSRLAAAHGEAAGLAPRAAARKIAEDLLASQHSTSIRATARILWSGRSEELRDLLLWVYGYTQYRKERIENWSTLIGGSGPRFIMASTIDYGYSLSGPPDTPVSIWQQVQLMGDLALNQPAGRLMHGLAGFNPVRHLLMRDRVEAMVDEAIHRQGFVGAKLYPPMGFQASGNRSLSMSEFKDPRITGDGIETALFWLYHYCAENDAVIQVHTSPSNTPHAYPHDGVGSDQSQPNNWALRADPKFWRAVLSKHRELRVNLAHFGGAYDICHNKGWADEVVALMRDFPNVYADFADFDLVLAGTSSRINDKNALADYLKALAPADRALVSSRIMFGTDWSLLGRSPGYALYPQDMLGFLHDTLGGPIDDYASRNAIRFLGLDDPAGKMAYRLRRFHAGNTAALQTLDRFIAQAQPRT